jgi:hypothetical protein
MNITATWINYNPQFVITSGGMFSVAEWWTVSMQIGCISREFMHWQHWSFALLLSIDATEDFTYSDQFVVKLWLLGVDHVECWQLSNILANICSCHLQGVCKLVVTKQVCISRLFLAGLCRAGSGQGIKCSPFVTSSSPPPHLWRRPLLTCPYHVQLKQLFQHFFFFFPALHKSARNYQLTDLVHHNQYSHPKDGNCSVCWNIGQLSAFDTSCTLKLRARPVCYWTVYDRLLPSHK